MDQLELAQSFAMMLMGQQKRSEVEVRALIAQRFSEVQNEFDAWLIEQRQANMLTSVAPEWRGQVVRDLARIDPHYPGPHIGMDVAWRATEAALRSRLGQLPLERLNAQSTDLVSSLGDPHKPLSARRGLVVGHVQSGKTANYTATIAKAADWGYSLVVVLSGLHTSLRRQTQARLDQDVVAALRSDRHPGDWAWHWLTEAQADFSSPTGSPDALLQERSRTIAVVKKNVKRLESLVKWLETADEAIRQRAAMLVIDDESDQASINTAKIERTAINRLIVQLLQVIPTSSYVGFTATPYASVLIDPSDSDDLYPRDFIIALPKPDGYQGSEVLFGRNELDGEDPVDGFDIVRDVPDADRDALVPPTNKIERDAFHPAMTKSLADALRWFLLATAARRARGQFGDSSCLVHTSRYIDQHFRLADLVRAWIDEVDIDDPLFLAQWEREAAARAPSTSAAVVAFGELRPHLPDVLADVRVAVDNGVAAPELRLSYSDVPETVIAVGGDTLSRGLTLEGLVASYFVRGSRTYDALMQMGRWFGFRPDYEDLSRLWTDRGTMAAFRHLSTVEQEIRSDIAAYSGRRTPADLALRIRTHPTLAVTSPNKMRYATRAQVSYASARMQTTFFEAHDADWLGNNYRAADVLVEMLGKPNISNSRPGTLGWASVDPTLVEHFLTSYRFHPDHAELDADRIVAWLARRSGNGNPVAWNVVVAGREFRETLHWDGEDVDLGTIRLGRQDFNAISRARLKNSAHSADIGALMSKQDRSIDLPSINSDRPANEVDDDRDRIAPGTALLVLYPVSERSVPRMQESKTREPLEAKGPVIGVGIMMPKPINGVLDDLVEAEYVSVDLPGEDASTEEYEGQLLRGDLDDEADSHANLRVDA